MQLIWGAAWEFVLLMSSQVILTWMVCSCCCVCSVAQLCLSLCDPTDCSLPGSSIHGISQARMLEWVAVSFPRGSSQPRDQTCVSWVSALAGGFFTTEPLGKQWSADLTSNSTIASAFWILTPNSFSLSSLSHFLPMLTGFYHPNPFLLEEALTLPTL